MTSFTVDVYCLVPYRKKSLCEAAPPVEKVYRNREIVYAFKNGRTMHSHGGHSFEKLLKRIVSAYKTSPLGAAAPETTWIPIPRSGASQPSTDANSDRFPARTLGIQLATQLGGSMVNIFTRAFPLTEKRNIHSATESLKIKGQLPESSGIVLLDDTYVTGATIASCAAMLHESGFAGTIAAFCIGYDVAASKATELHERKTHWRITWSSNDKRPAAKFIGRWGAEEP